MPLYEYKCHGCGKKFEIRQKFADDPLTTHDDCGGTVERLISAPTLQFKGTGWYVTDYGRKGNSSGSNGTNGKPESKTDSTKADKSEGPKSESKGDSTPKSESKSL